MLENIRIVLVAPTHPGNIGATARAMKTMGLSRLYLVNPKRYPDQQATERAAQAVDILDQAQLFSNLHDAIADCQLVFGTSVRERALAWPMKEPDAAAKHAVEQASTQQIAIVFGREHAGLTNEELELCHCQIQIPAAPEYSSLNLAAAVQVIAYEIRKQYLTLNPVNKNTDEATEWTTVAEMEYLYAHFEEVLQQVNFLKPTVSLYVMDRLRRLFARTRVEKTEMKILRGILSAIQESK